MLSRLCSTNSTKAVAFLYGEELLCAGVGSELRVYDSASECPEDTDSSPGCSRGARARFRARGETFPTLQETEADGEKAPPPGVGTGDAGARRASRDSLATSSPPQPGRPAAPSSSSSRLVANALFAPSTHIQGLATSSLRGQIAAYGLGRLVLYQLQWRDGGGVESHGRKKREREGVVEPPSPEAPRDDDGAPLARARGSLSALFELSSPQWILDVRILETDAVRRSACPLLLAGFAHGGVELLDAACGARLAAWMCTDRSLLYSLAIQVPDSSAATKQAPAEEPVRGRGELHAPRAAENGAGGGNCGRQGAGDVLGDAHETCRRPAVPTTPSESSVTIASGTVYSSILMWRVDLPARSSHTPAAPSSEGADQEGAEGSPRAIAVCSDASDARTQSPLGGLSWAETAHVNQVASRSGRADKLIDPSQILKGHRGVIFKLRFYLEGMLLCSASDDREVRVWWRSACEAAPGDASALRGPSADCSEPLPALQETQKIPEYSCVATLKGHRSRVWDIALLDLSARRPSRSGGVSAEDARPAGARSFEDALRSCLIVSAGEDSSCRIWSLRGELLYSLLGHAGRGVRAVCTPELPSAGRLPLIGSGGEDGDVKLWSLEESPSFLGTLEAHLAQCDDAAARRAAAGKVSGLSPPAEKGTAQPQASPLEARREVVWNSREGGRRDDFVREVRLLHSDSALVATNFGRVYFLRLRPDSCGPASRHNGVEGRQEALAAEDLARASHGDSAGSVAAFLLVEVPAVLTCLRALDGLVAAGCADGTAFCFRFFPDSVAALPGDSRGKDRRPAEGSNMKPVLPRPSRWQCFRRARVGNLFQVALPASRGEVALLRLLGPLGGLHAAARSSFSNRSYWSEVCGRVALSADGSPSRSKQDAVKTPASAASGLEAPSAAGGASGRPCASPRHADCVDFEASGDTILVATDHAGLVSLWHLSGERKKDEREAVVESRPEEACGMDYASFPEAEELLEPEAPDSQAPPTQSRVSEGRGDTESVSASPAREPMPANPAVTPIQTVQLPNAGGKRTDPSRCFSCLGLLCVADSSCEAPAAEAGDLGVTHVGREELAILLVLGDETGSLHVVQTVVPETPDSSRQASESKAGGPRGGREAGEKSRVRWAWSAARSRLAHTVQSAHKGKKVWDVAAHGEFLISCGGDGTILFFQVTKQAEEPCQLTQKGAEASAGGGELAIGARFPFSVTISAVSCVKVPQLTFMHSLVPTETAPAWWSVARSAASGDAAVSGDPLRHHWLCAFRTADFVLFDFRTSMELMHVRCGNSRRPLDFHRENSNRYTFASATKHLLYFHTRGRSPGLSARTETGLCRTPTASRMPCLGEPGDRPARGGACTPSLQGHGQDPATDSEDDPGETGGLAARGSDDLVCGHKALALKDGTGAFPVEDERRSASFNPGFHGREVWSACWLDDRTLATGGEDNSVKIINLVGEACAEAEEESRDGLSRRDIAGCQGDRSAAPLSGYATSVVRGFASFGEPSPGERICRRPPRPWRPRWRLQVLQTAVHHAAAVRVVRLLTCLFPAGASHEAEAVPRILVSVGACDMVSLFFVPPSGCTEEDGGRLGSSLSRNSLLMRHLLSARLSERGMGTDVRLNGVDGFLEHRCASFETGPRNNASFSAKEPKVLTAHLWTAASAAEVAYLRATVDYAAAEDFNALAGRDKDSKNLLEKRAYAPLEGAALCVRTVVLDRLGMLPASQRDTQDDIHRPEPAEARTVLILVGMTTGEIAVFVGGTSETRLHLQRMSTLKAHQCGVNDLEVTETDLSGASALASNSSSRVRGDSSPAPAESHSSISRRFCVASCGDDQSVTIQFVGVEYDPGSAAAYSLRVFSACRVENAHASSARSCTLFFPLLFTVGWDRWVQVWNIAELARSSGGEAPDTNPAALLNDGGNQAKRPAVALCPSTTAQRLNARSSEYQERNYWGEYGCGGPSGAQPFSVERIDAIKTSVADVAHLDGRAVAGGIRLCAVGSSGGIDCFLFRGLCTEKDSRKT
ncbi:WD domain, G-beta repeat-containing protein [Besnoitia besnoiti]|uniref:WD domain, G-beta repeat-containing protein n=1 Tax=Besnoitia besnoiti TaxID=94643 RepID=A0A2A9M7Y6_BESBE|nr:WD domain, G-beta repeat-containing protein [Besnoitia besnoiti]PFH34039.1 WD domain, G-beta repeat-containing protein [Besnoitia besnoiti]